MAGSPRLPPPLTDRPRAETEAINAASCRYFDRDQARDYWLNRPLSDRPPDPSSLWRFRLLVAALRLPPGSRVLDFGCGTGWTSTLLARLGFDVLGMDVAPAANRDRTRGRAARPRSFTSPSFTAFSGPTAGWPSPSPASATPAPRSPKPSAPTASSSRTSTWRRSTSGS